MTPERVTHVARADFRSPAKYFERVVARRSQIRHIPRGSGIAHHPIGWCVMTMRFAGVGFGILFMVGACAPMPTVALQATPAELEILAGEWAGEYASAALGRHGLIEFKLKAGTD